MEPLKHDCGVAMIRLLKPLEYYQEKYGTWQYALNKLYLMMEKQHNRGQEGAGMACIKLGSEPGYEHMFRERAEGKNAITEIFGHVRKQFKDASAAQLSDMDSSRKSSLSLVSCIWDTSVIRQQAKKDCLMFILSCVAIIGVPRIYVYAATST